MCRLLGLASKKQVKIDYWFFDAEVPFKDFSEKKINKGPHNSGWGVAWLESNIVKDINLSLSSQGQNCSNINVLDYRWNIFKEGKEDVIKYNFNKISQIKSKIIVMHLRRASVGSETTKNAHPFSYQNYVFAHNGGIAIKGIINYLAEKFKKEIKTHTDSELYFLLIMQFLEETNDIIEAIKKTLNIVRKYNYKGLNFLMSDGENLYAFRDVSPEHKNLYGYYCLHYLVKDKNKDKNKEGIISSDPLTKDEWQPISLRELLIIDKNINIKKLIV